MPEILETNYQSLSDMESNTPQAPFKKFIVEVSGKTEGAHHSWVADLIRFGQVEGSTHENSDYTLLFCPIASRVGTDVSEALENVSDHKQVIVVVMHHTFNHEQTVADSRRLVTNPNVCLVVDTLFYNGHFLGCDRNDIAFREIKKHLGVPAPPVKLLKLKSPVWGIKRIKECPIIVAVVVIVVLVVTVTIIALVLKKK